MHTDRVRQLMMARLDGELGEAERRELEAALAESTALRDEMERLAALARRLARYRLRDPADDAMAELDLTLTKRAGLPLGWLLLLAGLLILAAWGLLSWFRQSGVHPGLRIAGGAVLAGALLLLLVKIRERWIERRGDLYRDIVR